MHAYIYIYTCDVTKRLCETIAPQSALIISSLSEVVSNTPWHSIECIDYQCFVAAWHKWVKPSPRAQVWRIVSPFGDSSKRFADIEMHDLTRNWKLKWKRIFVKCPCMSIWNLRESNEIIYIRHNGTNVNQLWFGNESHAYNNLFRDSISWLSLVYRQHVIIKL